MGTPSLNHYVTFPKSTAGVTALGSEAAHREPSVLIYPTVHLQQGELSFLNLPETQLTFRPLREGEGYVASLDSS